MKIKLYRHETGNHIVLYVGKVWVSLDRTGFMTWNGKRNHFFLFKKPITRLSKIFHN